jgi:hypothetical protein
MAVIPPGEEWWAISPTTFDPTVRLGPAMPSSAGGTAKRLAGLLMHENVHTEIPFARVERPLTSHSAQHHGLGMDRRGPRGQDAA